MALPFLLTPVIVYCAYYDKSDPGPGLFSCILIGSFIREMTKPKSKNTTPWI